MARMRVDALYRYRQSRRILRWFAAAIVLAFGVMFAGLIWGICSIFN